MIVGAYVRTLLVRSLFAVFIVIRVGVRVRVHTGLSDCAGVAVNVLECRCVRAAEDDPEDHKQGQDEGSHRSAANTRGVPRQHRRNYVFSK